MFANKYAWKNKRAAGTEKHFKSLYYQRHNVDERKKCPWSFNKGNFLSENEIDISNCQTYMPNHYLKVEILKLSSITVKCCISVSV